MKKKLKEHFWQSWWFKMIVIPVVLMPAVVMSWKNITLIWASPEKVAKIEGKVEKQQTAQEQVAALLLKEEARNDKQEALYKVQMESMKEQLQLIAELKKQ